MLGIGFVAGTLAGLLGAGSGIFIVMLLVLLFGLDQHRAHGTSLAAVLMLSVANVATYTFHGNIDPSLALELIVGGAAGAWVGARVAHGVEGRALRLAFSIFLAILGVRMLVHGCQGPQCDVITTVQAGLTLSSALAGLGIGIVGGLIGTLLGIGGGVIIVPAVVILLGIGQKIAQGSSTAAMLATTSVGMLVYRAQGNADLRLSKWIGLGGVAGAIIGATLAAGLNATVLRLVFGAFLLVTAVVLALKQRNGAAV